MPDRDRNSTHQFILRKAFGSKKSGEKSGITPFRIAFHSGIKSSGNPKYVYDSSDYTRFKTLQEKNRAYVKKKRLDTSSMDETANENTDVNVGTSAPMMNIGSVLGDTSVGSENILFDCRAGTTPGMYVKNEDGTKNTSFCCGEAALDVNLRCTDSKAVCNVTGNPSLKLCNKTFPNCSNFTPTITVICNLEEVSDGGNLTSLSSEQKITSNFGATHKQITLNGVTNIGLINNTIYIFDWSHMEQYSSKNEPIVFTTLPDGTSQHSSENIVIDYTNKTTTITVTSDTPNHLYLFLSGDSNGNHIYGYLPGTLSIYSEEQQQHPDFHEEQRQKLDPEQTKYKPCSSDNDCGARQLCVWSAPQDVSKGQYCGHHCIPHPTACDGSGECDFSVFMKNVMPRESACQTSSLACCTLSPQPEYCPVANTNGEGGRGEGGTCLQQINNSHDLILASIANTSDMCKKFESNINKHMEPGNELEMDCSSIYNCWKETMYDETKCSHITKEEFIQKCNEIKINNADPNTSNMSIKFYASCNPANTRTNHGVIEPDETSDGFSPDDEVSSVDPIYLSENGVDETIEPPTEKNWITENSVTPIKNQGSCGSCVTFGLNATIEAAYKIKHGTLISLSEQQMLDCVPRQTCDGSWPQRVYDDIKDNNIGICSAAEYPYFSGCGSMVKICNAPGDDKIKDNVSCRYLSNNAPPFLYESSCYGSCNTSQCTNKVTLLPYIELYQLYNKTEYEYLTIFQNASHPTSTSTAEEIAWHNKMLEIERLAMQAISQKGVLSAAMYVNNSFQHGDGFVSPETRGSGMDEEVYSCTRSEISRLKALKDNNIYFTQQYNDAVLNEAYRCTTRLNHAVAIVGYDTKTDRNGVIRNYWIVKNSWGFSFANKGFINIERYSTGGKGADYGLLRYAFYAVVE